MSYQMRGVIPPMITPFTQNGAVDLQAEEQLIRFLDTKVDGVFVCGSYGSGPMMSVAERKLVVETAAKIRGNLQLIAMVGACNTQDTVELAVHARDAGCDAISAVTPYYYHHNMDDVIGFYQDIVDAVGPDFPVYIYTNPKFSGYNVDMKTMHRLREIGIHGVKAASFDMMEFASYKREFVSTDFDIVLGTEALWLPASVYGAKAYIPGLANAFPEICRKMYEQSQQGDFEGCLETQYQVNALREVMYLAKSTQLSIYAMLEIRDIVTCYPRKPFQPASTQEIAAIRSRLQEMKLLDTSINEKRG